MEFDGSNFWIHCIFVSQISASTSQGTFYMRVTPDQENIAMVSNISTKSPGMHGIGFEAIFMG